METKHNYSETVFKVMMPSMGFWSRMFNWSKSKYRGPDSRFHEGDSVQLKEGGRLMVVYKIFTAREMKEPLIECKWYESETKQNRTNVFRETKLKIA